MIFWNFEVFSYIQKNGPKDFAEFWNVLTRKKMADNELMH